MTIKRLGKQVVEWAVNGIARPLVRGGKQFVEWGTNGIGRPLVRSFASQYFNVQTVGHLPNGSGICVFNHNVNFDGMLNAAFLKRREHFLMQREGVYDGTLKKSFKATIKSLVSANALRALYWASGTIPISVDKSSGGNIGVAVARRTIEYLHAGELVGIFSEGPSSCLVDESGKAISLEDRVHKDIAASMALKRRVPIIPVGLYVDEQIGRDFWQNRGFKETARYMNVYNSERAKEIKRAKELLIMEDITRGDKYHKVEEPKLERFRALYIIYIGEPIKVEGYLPRTDESKVRLTADVKSKIVDLVQKAREYAYELNSELVSRRD